MFRLRRLYLDLVGAAENRFADLTVELTDVSGKPTDSIVWLRNGAGKTTMLSLLLALIRPGRRDLLAHRTKNRTLEDLILSDDTAHVAAEWGRPGGELLLTGDGVRMGRPHKAQPTTTVQRKGPAAAELADHPDPTSTGATLERCHSTFRTTAPCMTRESSAVMSPAGSAVQGVNAVVADQTIGEWHAALRERRFDPERACSSSFLVNAAEGGIDGLFAQIDSPGKFSSATPCFQVRRQPRTNRTGTRTAEGHRGRDRQASNVPRGERVLR